MSLVKKIILTILVVTQFAGGITMAARTKEQQEMYYKDSRAYTERYQKLRDTNKGVFQMSLDEIFIDPQVCKLAKAASKCHLNKMDKLLAKGVDINAKGLNAITPLVAGLNCYDSFVYMLDHGADPNAVYYGGGAIMTFTAKYPTPEFLIAALKHGGDPNLITGGEPTTPNPLITAIVHKRWENVDILLANGADVNQWTPLGGHAGITAAQDERFELVYRFLEMGLKYYETNKYGGSVLEALGYGQYQMLCRGQEDPYFNKIVEWLAERGVTIPEWRPVTNLCPRLTK